MQRPLSSRVSALLDRSLRDVATHPWVAIVVRGLNREITRLTVLLFLVLYVVHPFLSRAFFGSWDAIWYNHLLNDVLRQARAGIFPIYVGQSEFSWNGFPIVRIPYFLYLGAFIDLLTGRHFDPIAIQHLTVITTALAAAFVLYYLLVALEPTLRWESVALSILYLTCPGVLALAYTTDQYTSWMTLPYLPTLIYGIIRLIRRDDYWASLIIGGSLSLLWMSHAPIALWATMATGLSLALTAIFTRRVLSTIGKSFVATSAFALLSSWYFVSVFALGLAIPRPGTREAVSTSSFFTPVNPVFIAATLKQLHAVMPGVFLPVPEPPGGMVAFQLGYSLWLLLLLSLWVATRRFDVSLTTLLACVGSFMVLLYPIPHVTSFAWRHLPSVIQITKFWPMQRFYVIVAAFCCFLGLFFLKRRNGIPPFARSFLPVLLIGLGLWSLVEAKKFLNWGHRKATWSHSRSVPLSEHVKLWFSCLPGARCYKEDYSDPVLENRLLDASNLTARASNRESVILQSQRLEDQAIQFAQSVLLSCHNGNCRFTDEEGALRGKDIVLPVLKLRMQPNKKYMLRFRFRSSGYKGMFQLIGDRFLREYWNPDQGMKEIPLWTSDPNGKEITLRFSGIFIGACSKEIDNCWAELQSISFGTYEHASLPIKVSSLMPYSAKVEVDQPAFLETHRLYLPGYQATVNGLTVSVARSPEGMTMIPLNPGKNEVRLDYRGTPAMRYAFVLTTVSWCGILGVVLMMWTRKRWRRYRGKMKGALSPGL